MKGIKEEVTPMVFAVLCLAVLLLSGCAVLDWLFGVSPKDGAQNPNPPSGILGTILGTVLPGAGGVLAAAGGLYAELRRRKWKEALVKTADVIEAGAKLGVSAKDLKKDLAKAHADAGVIGIVKAVVDKYGHGREAAAPPPP